MPKPQSLFFFLGGRDLEMRTIAELVTAHLGPEHVIDRGLGWGAGLSDHADGLAGLAEGAVPVLVELALDQPIPQAAIIVDHHGDAAGHPTALEQVFALLGLASSAWTRHLALVAANDRGHVRAMRAMGARPEEILSIRAADRAAQGILAEEDRAGAAALAAAETVLGGRLCVVRLPHGRTATVMDPIAAATPEGQIRDVLIICPAEVDFYGRGAAIRALDSAFPGGWSGGDLPHAGFWGHGAPVPETQTLVAILGGALTD